MAHLKQWDLFRKLPNDHFPETAIGGFFSILAFLLMAWLFVVELQIYISPSIATETLVDIAREDMIQVNLNLTLPNIPCGMLSMDLQDSTGGHEMDISGSFHKLQIASNGRLITNKPVDGTLSAIREAVNKGEYCRLEGGLNIASAPGNFHISFHNQHGLVHQLMFTELRKMRLEHHLHHLSFGKDVSSLFGGAQLFSPYDNLTITFPADQLIYTHDYYIKIIPTQVFDLSTGLHFYSYQYSMNQQYSPTNSAFGAIYFRYDIDSVTVRYTKNGQSLTHFLINVCAILGGVFAVIGICHSVTQAIWRVSKGR